MNKIMKYKVGDKVTLTNGNIMTIDQIDDISKWYRMREDPWSYYTDEMIEGLAEEETKPKYEDEIELIGYSSPKQFLCPIGYEFRDENDNIIPAQKIVLKKKKPKYPKTYKECAEIIAEYTGSDCNPKGCMGYKSTLLTTFQKLLVCRDAYWKIAGEEMGLDKPWKPNWNNSEEIGHSIVNIKGNINLPAKELTKWVLKVTNKILVFPTVEMRDAFYENFKELIEQCKGLL